MTSLERFEEPSLSAMDDSHHCRLKQRVRNIRGAMLFFHLIEFLPAFDHPRAHVDPFSLKCLAAVQRTFCPGTSGTGGGRDVGSGRERTRAKRLVCRFDDQWLSKILFAQKGGDMAAEKSIRFVP